MKYPGNHLIEFLIKKERGSEKIRTTFRINYSEVFKTEMEKLLGAGSIQS
jgi:hypothetical protein